METIKCHTVIIVYKLLLVSCSPHALPGWWVIKASPLRGSRYRVLNVLLWPVCSGYKCPLRCLLEPGLQSRGNSLCTMELCVEQVNQISIITVRCVPLLSWSLTAVIFADFWLTMVEWKRHCEPTPPVFSHQRKSILPPRKLNCNWKWVSFYMKCFRVLVLPISFKELDLNM